MWRPSSSAASSASADSAVLTSVADEGDYAQIFAKQVRALGNPGDLLLVLSHQGGSPTLLTAVDAAHEQDMTVIALTGNGGGLLGARLAETDVHICVPHERAVRIQEVHSLVLHCICDAVDLQLLGEQDNA
jgi:D-sedoheptulose 7-phosphate isomerase